VADQLVDLLHGARKEYQRSVPLAILHPNPWNPNVQDDATYRAERESIRIYGFIDPVTVRPHPERQGEFQIIDGEHRTKAARDEGHDEVDIIVLHGLSDPQAEKLTVILNETRGTADEAKLAALLKRIEEQTSRDELKLGLPYDDDALERMIQRAKLEGEIPAGIDLDDVPEPPAEPKSRRGEVYELGAHRLMCGDSAEIEDVQVLMGGATAHMVMADPPYNVEYTGGSSNTSRPRADSYEDDRGDEYGPWLRQILENAAAWSDAEAALHLWFAIMEMRAVIDAIDGAGWERRTLIVWAKSAPTGQGFAQYKSQFENFYYCHKKGKSPRWFGPTAETTLWQYDKQSRNELHPVMRPVEMYQREITNHTQPGHSVLELFGGSGTTLIACEVAQRRAFVMEISESYCDVIRDRWARLEQARANIEWSQEAV
jgi:ParB/RepB/Spo0J family partition protein